MTGMRPTVASRVRVDRTAVAALTLIGERRIAIEKILSATVLCGDFEQIGFFRKVWLVDRPQIPASSWDVDLCLTDLVN
jgi:hypothetical protein